MRFRMVHGQYRMRHAEMNIPWDDVQLFLAVAETGSLSAAAKRLQVGQPTVSRRLAQLEYLLDTLFRRQAGGAVLTNAGARLVEPARKMADWAGEITRVASSADRSPAGVVRVTAAPGVAFDVLAPFSAVVKARHPKLQLEVLSAVHHLDLARGEADLALRLRAPTSSDLTVVATLKHRVAVFASKEYAAALPKKYGFADVDWIAWAPPHDQLPPTKQLEEIIPGFKPVFTSDNFLVQWRAADAGVGAIILADVQHRFSAPSSLVKLKLDLGPYSTSELHLVCAKSALDIPRVRAVAELLTAELQAVQRA